MLLSCKKAVQAVGYDLLIVEETKQQEYFRVYMLKNS